MGKCLPGPQRAPGVYGQTPKLPYNKIPVFCGFLIDSWDAPGRPGKAHGSHLEKWLISAKYFSPGLLTSPGRDIILQDDASKLPENLEISSGSRKEAAASPVHQELQEIERKRMDWLLGLLIPLKWALVLVIIYFVLTAIL